ncbi:FAD-dependent monooxygenase OpS4 [Colletotrichum spaethianum]|uniref:FAD-dependent monooxygenase OpS4 n=1 Tax=Colletotrichum spaethianum TaxID=700344 RepID=A0AA37PAH3_9PEZI|nr:FAD-dependent monooxygenase OpS4 [Colletotrichum spaethianum]GKT48652.1 FAD-dependent monooxygenase OpS4 [Colletotrichum spaethianum]
MSDPKELKIAIIGAGMGGLGCALALAKKGFNHIDVYETASNLGFVGAGIQMPPNVVRVLDRLGCWPDIEKTCTDVKGSSIRQGSTNVELAHVDMPNIRELYGYPHCNDHRSSLAGGLYGACKKEPAVTFHFATALASIDSFAPKPSFTVQPRDGEARSVEADVLLACDGIKSIVRSSLLDSIGAVGGEEETGQAAYRIMLTREQMAGDPELLALLDSDEVVRWIGEKRHIIAYPVSSHTIYNLSTTQPDSNFAAATNATYTTRGSKKVMLDVFHDFCPLVHRMLNLVPDGEVCEWRLRMHKPLPAWVHTDGPVALLGDACHPTLPHLSQGAAMAIEDGSVVAEVLARAPDTKPATLRRCLKAYELSRRDWTSQLVNMAFLSGKQLHLGEGKAKEERDRMFAEHKSAGAVPDKWASPDVQRMIYTNDCVANIQRDFDELYKSAA